VVEEHDHEHKHCEHHVHAGHSHNGATPHEHGEHPAHTGHAGHACHHFEEGPNWGPLRRGLVAGFRGTGLLDAGERWGEDLRVQLASGASLAACVALTQLSSGAEGALAGGAAAGIAVNALMCATYVLSGVPSFVEAAFQVGV